jgi:radical SAM protein with 4Fe4S-binding SPASM domain
MADRTRPPGAKTFLDHRLRQEDAHIGKTKWNNDPMSSLVSVEVNIIDGCNRKCHFCPHAKPKIYPNRYDWKMSNQIVSIIGAQLRQIDYRGRISMSGYGEPMLNKEVAGHISNFRSWLPNNIIEMNTNGDPLTVANIQRVFEAGLTEMYVNLYDNKRQISHFIKMFREAGRHNYILRPHFDPDDNYGLIINNRSGIMNPKKKALEKRCHYTFYKMFIDWNGDVLFCANDWGRNLIVGNICHSHIKDIWMSDQMKKIRLPLAEGDRSMHPCSQCNVNGTLHGKSSFDTLMKHYGKHPS